MSLFNILQSLHSVSSSTAKTRNIKARNRRKWKLPSSSSSSSSDDGTVLSKDQYLGEEWRDRGLLPHQIYRFRFFRVVWKASRKETTTILSLSKFQEKTNWVTARFECWRPSGTTRTRSFIPLRIWRGSPHCHGHEFDGNQLFDYRRTFSDKIVPDREAKEMTRQLLKALVHLEKVNVVHTDIKPENILVDRQSDDRLLCSWPILAVRATSTPTTFASTAKHRRTGHPKFV